MCDCVCSMFVSVVSCRFGCETITSYCHLNHLKQACFHSLLLLQLYTVRSHRWNIIHISTSMTSSYGNMKTVGWWINNFLAHSLGQIWHWQYLNEKTSFLIVKTLVVRNRELTTNDLYKSLHSRRDWVFI